MMDAHTTVRAFSLVSRVAHLNRDAGEIGAGMLASLVDEANTIMAAYEPRKVHDVVATLSELCADGLLLRDMLAVSVSPDIYETFIDVAEGIESAPGYVAPTTVAEARAHLSNALELTKRTHP